MQFRTQGKRIQVLAYRGYDRDKKRAQVKLLGSFDAYDLTPTEELLSILTDDEKKKLQSHIDSFRQAKRDSNRQSEILYCSTHLKNVADALVYEKHIGLVTQQYADEVYAGMDDLAKRLRKLGFKRSARGADTAQTSEVLPSQDG